MNVLVQPKGQIRSVVEALGNLLLGLHKYRLHVVASYAVALFALGVGSSLSEHPRAKVIYLAWCGWQLGVYLFNKTCDLTEDSVSQPRERLSDAEVGVVRFLSVGLLAAPAAVLMWAGSPAWIGVVLALIGYAYSAPLPGLRRRAKDLFVLKNLYSAVLVWSGSVWLYTAAIHGLGAAATHTPWTDLVAFALDVWAVELLWDMRDEAGDRVAGVRTIPVVLGSRRGRLVAVVASLAALAFRVHAGSASVTVYAMPLVAALLPTGAPGLAYHLVVDAGLLAGVL